MPKQQGLTIHDDQELYFNIKTKYKYPVLVVYLHKSSHMMWPHVSGCKKWNPCTVTSRRQWPKMANQEEFCKPLPLNKLPWASKVERTMAANSEKGKLLDHPLTDIKLHATPSSWEKVGVNFDLCTKHHIHGPIHNGAFLLFAHQFIIKHTNKFY